jgi:hypothetical protein
MLEQFDQRTLRARMLLRADLYGEGLRWALALEKEQGAGAVLQRCREPDA